MITFNTHTGHIIYNDMTLTNITQHIQITYRYFKVIFVEFEEHIRQSSLQDSTGSQHQNKPKITRKPALQTNIKKSLKTYEIHILIYFRQTLSRCV